MFLNLLKKAITIHNLFVSEFLYNSKWVAPSDYFAGNNLLLNFVKYLNYIVHT